MNVDFFNEITNYCDRHDVKLVAVSKKRSVEEIEVLHSLGHNDFGENRIQEWVEKLEFTNPNLHWHLIGHIQTNKLKQVVQKPFLIHSGDRIRLLDALEELGLKRGINWDVLIQIKIAEEESKHGFTFEDLYNDEILRTLSSYKCINFRGVMGMASQTDDFRQIRSEFQSLYHAFSHMQEVFADKSFSEISMGMSNDYELAVEEGATIIRVGSAIFD